MLLKQKIAVLNLLLIPVLVKKDFYLELNSDIYRQQKKK